jgi:hypothetical protein
LSDQAKSIGSPAVVRPAGALDATRPHARKSKFAQRNQARWRIQDMARKIFGLIFSENQQLFQASRLD